MLTTPTNYHLLTIMFKDLTLNDPQCWLHPPIIMSVHLCLGIWLWMTPDELESHFKKSWRRILTTPTNNNVRTPMLRDLTLNDPWWPWISLQQTNWRRIVTTPTNYNVRTPMLREWPLVTLNLTLQKKCHSMLTTPTNYHVRTSVLGFDLEWPLMTLNLTSSNKLTSNFDYTHQL